MTSMLSEYARVKDFAFSLEDEGYSVRIRLDQAYEAAIAGKEADFHSLISSISKTLDERFQRILAAHHTLKTSPPPIESATA